ncbi:MAG: flavodoxin [Paludibacter sp.]|nr:flavodoxin [Paludibacter sp.]
MKKIGLFYGKNTVKTANVAKKIQEAFGDNEIDLVTVEDAWKKEFESYKYLIAGTSTWFDGELPNSWDELMPLLNTLDLKNKKVAIFGLGNQKDYPDNFVDGIGILAEVFEKVGAKIVGFTSAEEYDFNHSLAFKDEKFVGLVIDVENQAKKTDKRVKDWVESLKKEFQ